MKTRDTDSFSCTLTNVKDKKEKWTGKKIRGQQKVFFSEGSCAAINYNVYLLLYYSVSSQHPIIHTHTHTE